MLVFTLSNMLIVLEFFDVGSVVLQLFVMVYLGLVRLERVKLLGRGKCIPFGLLRVDRGLGVVQLEPL